MKPEGSYQVAIVGGGFFGCCLALFLRSIFSNIVVIEREAELLTRASQVNQARIHTGFHYPRSFITALRSRHLQQRFALDFKEAVKDDFVMLYAIARRRSKVSANRFYKMYQAMEAPIHPASPGDSALFDQALIEGVFACQEYAFDWTVLRHGLREKLDAHGIETRTQTSVASIDTGGDQAVIHTEAGEALRADIVFNVTYGMLNAILRGSGMPLLALKHELAEVALIEPPPAIEGKAITVMDGPFFSVMPYPAKGLYSLTHVRYTPHMNWTDEQTSHSSYEVARRTPVRSHWKHMMLDAKRYVPSLSEVEYKESLFDVKTLLQKNEKDHGRPILFHQHSSSPGVYSVLGGKIDNIYDLFETLQQQSEFFAKANDGYLFKPIR